MMYGKSTTQMRFAYTAPSATTTNIMDTLASQKKFSIASDAIQVRLPAKEDTVPTISLYGVIVSIVKKY